MPKFVVSKGHDAFVYYETIVEGEWLATRYVQEFDDYEIDEHNGVRPLEDGETVEAFLFISVTSQERDALLAGLRLLQLALAGEHIDPQLRSILTNDGAHAGLDLNQIDALCERTNI